MIDPQFCGVLRILCARLDGCPIPWAVTGSLGMALQGMDLAVHDIDLQTSREGAYEIERRLAEYGVEPVRFLASERIHSHFGAAVIDGVKVEIMGDLQKLLETGAWEAPVSVETYRRWINFEDLRVPVLDLAYEAQAYRRMGRIEKAEKIQRWLEEYRSGKV